jgi:hypothetical protein
MLVGLTRERNRSRHERRTPVEVVQDVKIVNPSGTLVGIEGYPIPE